MQSIQLSSGVQVPTAIATKALQRALSAQATEQSVGVKSGTWKTTSSDALFGGAPTFRDNRKRDYESYLSTSLSIPWVYQALTTIAGAYSSAEYKIVTTDGATETVVNPKDAGPRYKKLQKLLGRPNPWMTGPHFRALLIAHYVLTGNAFILKDAIDPITKLPTELYLLRPSLIKIIPDPVKFIAGYEYTVNGDKRTFTPDQIVWFRRFNPRDEYWGLGVVEPAELIFRKLAAIARTTLSFFDSGARIKGVLSFDGSLTPEQDMALRESWRGMDEGQSGIYTTAVLQGGMEYTPIQSDLVAHGDGMETLAKDARDELLAAFGVPKQKVGIFEDANFRSVEADSFFVGETMIPYFRETNDGWSAITKLFTPANADDDQWEYRHVEKVVVDYADKAITAHFLAQAGSFERNEIREMAGQRPYPDGEILGTQILGPTTMTIYDEGGPVLMGKAPGAGPGNPYDPAQMNGVATPDAAATESSDLAPAVAPPAGVSGGLGSVLGTKSAPQRRGCGCPTEITLDAKSKDVATFASLGVCPKHAHAVHTTLQTARRRRYSAAQTVRGYTSRDGREQFGGLLGALNS